MLRASCLQQLEVQSRTYPYFFRVVLDETRLRVELLVLHLKLGHYIPVLVEHDAARAARALVNARDVRAAFSHAVAVFQLPPLIAALSEEVVAASFFRQIHCSCAPFSVSIKLGCARTAVVPRA